MLELGFVSVLHSLFFIVGLVDMIKTAWKEDTQFYDPSTDILYF